jgi:putative CocE/NonD family hydrolase
VSAVEVRDERVPMRDGVLLAADVVLESGSAPRPVLLVRTPYSRGAMRLVHDVVGLARAGWAVVVQDVRGRFESGGAFAPFEQEVDDGYDTVDWCTQQRWCDGRVAMTGWSYVGATQWLAALSRHPALLAINPIVGGGDLGEAMMREGGAFQIGLVQPWVLGLAASDPRADDAHRQRAGALGAAWPQTLRARVDDDPVADLIPHYRDWRAGRPATISAHYEDITAATFQVAGWYDIFCESALRHFTALAGSERPHRLVMGPWSHSNGLSNLHSEVDFGGPANGAYGGVLGGALEWVRRVLDGEAVPSGMTCFVMHEGWRDLGSWPPPSLAYVLELDDGRLQTTPGAEGAAVLLHDPSDPVPTRGGRVLGPFLPPPGPVDQRPLMQRPDVAVFTSDPLAEPLTIIGAVASQLRIESTASCVDVAVKLCDVEPDGRSLNVVDSISRVGVTPGEPLLVDVAVGSTAYCFRRGHRVQLMVSGSNFPRFDVSPEAAAAHTLRWGPDSGSRLLLPRC